MKSLLGVVLFVLVATSTLAVQVEERDGVPMAFCGRYRFEAESNDKGKTIKALESGAYVDISRYYVQGSRISFAGKVIGCNVGVADDGSSAAGIFLDTFPEGFFWIVQQNYRDSTTAIIYMMQTKGDKTVELRRFGCSVER